MTHTDQPRFTHPIQISIDGESATGKSTLAGILAERFSQIGVNIWIVDTGQAYRLLTLIAINRGLLSNGALSQSAAGELTDLAGSGRISFITTVAPGQICPVALDQMDCSSQLQSARLEIDEHVSEIAKCGVRPHLINLFQQTASDLKNVIMVGRDIGARVLPQALKFYLVAASSVRARRRAAQLNSPHSRVQSSLASRDHTDIQHQALVKPQDAITIDTQLHDIPSMADIAWTEVAAKFAINSGASPAKTVN